MNMWHMSHFMRINSTIVTVTFHVLSFFSGVSVPSSPILGWRLFSCRPSSASIVGHATFVIPRTYTRLGGRAFPVAGPRLWNSLPSNLQQSDLTLHQFRGALKTYLLVDW